MKTNKDITDQSPSTSTYKEYPLLNFDSEYQAKKYPKNLWPILNEYFSRYKYEFQLDDEALHQKFVTTINNLNTINLRGNIKNSWYGCYYPEEKAIEINMARISRTDHIQPSTVVNSIFHELNHITENSGSQINTSFARYNFSTSRCEGTALNEIITEMKSSRLVTSREYLLHQKGDAKHILNLEGYGDIIFAGSMIHSALGISEKEFLMSLDAGRLNFFNMLRARFPDDTSYKTFLDGITFNTDALFALKYNSNNSKKRSQDDLDNMQNYIQAIYDHCLTAMDKIIPYQAANGCDTKEYTKQCRFYLDKLNANYRHGMLCNLGINEVDVSQNDLLANVQDKILAIEAIAAQKDKLQAFEYSDLLSRLSQPNTNIKEHIQLVADKYNVTLDLEDKVFQYHQDDEYDKKMLVEDYGDTIWDNSECTQYVENLVRKENIFTKFFRRVFSKTPVALPSHTDFSPSSSPTTLGSLLEQVKEMPDYDNISPSTKDITIDRSDLHDSNR